MKISIRKIKEGDAAEISRLSSQLGYPTSEVQVLENIKELQQDPDYVVYVADTGSGKLAGFVHVYLARRLFLDGRAELGGLVVDEEYRGKGVGKSLLFESESWATSKDCDSICVRSNMVRTGAKGFYLSQGYDEKKQQWVFLKDLAG